MSLFGEKKSFFGRLSEKISDVIMMRAEVDEDLMDELEEVLITSDIGMDTTMHIMENLRSKIKNENITQPDKVKEALKEIMIGLVDKGERQVLCQESPLIVLMAVRQPPSENWLTASNRKENQSCLRQRIRSVQQQQNSSPSGDKETG